MKRITLQSYDEIDSFIISMQNPYIVFRGQSCSNYKLQTRIADKYIKSAIIKKKAEEILLTFKNKLLEANLINELYIDNSPFNECFFIFQSQHLGIPTFIMDFTNDWKKALFFSVFDEKNNNSFGQLWCFDASNMIYEPNYTGYYDPFINDSYRIINAAFGEGWENYASEKRKQIQGGRFLIYPVSDLYTPIENTYLNDRLLLIEISPECKEKIRHKYINDGKTPAELKNFVNNFQEKRSYDYSFFYPAISYELLNVINYVRVYFNFPLLVR